MVQDEHESKKARGNSERMALNVRVTLISGRLTMLGRRAEELRKRRAAFLLPSPPPPFPPFSLFHSLFLSLHFTPCILKREANSWISSILFTPFRPGSREATGGIFSHFSHPAFITLQFSGSVRIFWCDQLTIKISICNI